MASSSSCALISLATTLLLVGCQASVQPETSIIPIGFVGPLTGDVSPYGIDSLNGVRLAVDEMNAAGGIDGHSIRIVAEDARCTSADAASAAQKLVQVDAVAAIVGGICSGETYAMAPFTESERTIVMAPLSSAPDLPKIGKYVFRNYPSDAKRAETMARYLRDHGLTRVALLSENTDFGMAFRAALKANVGTDDIVFDEVVDPSTKDMRSLFTRLKGISFDAFVPNTQSDAVMAAALEQLRQQGLMQLAITHDVGDSLNLIALAPEAAEGLYVINVRSHKESQFAERFRSIFGEPNASMSYAVHAYDAAKIVLQAMKVVGTDGDALRAYLDDIEAYEGVAGTFHFDADGDSVGIPYMLKQIRSGEIVELQELPL